MIKVGIVDDHAILRMGVRNLLAKHVDIRLVGEAANARDAVDLVRTQPMDVLLLDLSMPQQSGLDVLALLRAKAPEMAILVLSGYPAEHYAINLLREGVSGYVSKGGDTMELVKAIRRVAAGKSYVSPDVAELLVHELDADREAPLHARLSAREFQVFLHLARGQTVGDAADAMSLSVATVSTYRTRIMAKMGVASNSDLTYYALKNGLIE